MKFRCATRCFFKSELWEAGTLCKGPEFAQNKHFTPLDDEALKEAAKYREGIEIPEEKPEIELDDGLMSKSVQELRSLYPMVEWKANMRKPEFVKSIMESDQWQAR